MRRNASAFLRILNRQNVPHSEVRFVKLCLIMRFQTVYFTFSSNSRNMFFYKLKLFFQLFVAIA